MLGTRGAQRGLFEADNLYTAFVGEETFYSFLAKHRGELFHDEDFEDLYCRNNGRPSVAPSLLATALVLQTYNDVSDDEAHRRAAFDLQWKVALGVEVETKPFAKSTLQEFRAQLITHEQQAAIFRKSLSWVRTWERQGRFGKDQRLRIALDTTNILGRGAVKDTINMLADGILLVLRAVAQHSGDELADWAEREGYGRYVTASSVKGAADIDWSDKQQRQRVLRGIVADADRLLATVRELRGHLDAGSVADGRLERAASLLSRVLAQDIERPPEGATLRDGVAKAACQPFTIPRCAMGARAKRSVLTALRRISRSIPTAR